MTGSHHLCGGFTAALTGAREEESTSPAGSADLVERFEQAGKRAAGLQPAELVQTHLQRATLQRLRQRWFLVPAQWVRPDGVPTLRRAPS